MRRGRDISNEFCDMAQITRIFNRYDNWQKGIQLERILLYLSDRFPDAFKRAVRHLKAIGKESAQ